MADLGKWEGGLRSLWLGRRRGCVTGANTSKDETGHARQHDGDADPSLIRLPRRQSCAIVGWTVGNHHSLQMPASVKREAISRGREDQHTKCKNPRPADCVHDSLVLVESIEKKDRLGGVECNNDIRDFEISHRKCFIETHDPLRSLQSRPAELSSLRPERVICA